MAIFTRSPGERVSMRTAPWPGADGQGPGPLGSARSALRKRWWWAVVAVVVAAGSLAAVEATAGPSTYPVTARFAQAPGLFPGAAVEVLGVPVGTVSSVKNVGDEVVVKLAVERGHPIPASVRASLVSPEILGEPSIDLSPGYTAGPSLRSGAAIPMSRTAVPVSTEQVLKSLRHTLERVNPHAVGDLVSNLAQDLRGQGKNLNKLIAGAAGTLKILATKASTLGQMNGSLAQLTGALDARTGQITQLITDYDTVSGVIAQHGSQLGTALVQLSQASRQLVELLVPNLGPLESEVGSITTVGRTLDRNLTSIDGLFSSEVALFTGARRVYTSTFNWLTLNLQAPAGLTGALLVGMVRSRLEGVCRRILAHHATGLSAAQHKTLETCGKTTSRFFTSILPAVTTILNDVREGKQPTTGSIASMFASGLAKIPGSKSASQKKTSTTPSTGPSSPGRSGSTGAGGNGSTGTPGKGATGGTGTTTTTKSRTSTCLDLLGILKCSSGTSTTSKQTSAKTTGSNGLLSYDVPAKGAHPPSVSAVGELPPLPRGVPGAARHRSHERLASHRMRRHERRAHRTDRRLGHRRTRRQVSGGGR